MLEYRTTGFQGYAVKYSPFFDNRIAVATSANFGLVGNGRLYVLELTPQGIQLLKWYPTQDALYDLTHSESHSSHLLTASGDGTLRLFDTSLAPTHPISTYREHGREAFSCTWNPVSKTTFASSSWDGTVKIWNPDRDRSILTLPTHSCTYSVQWCPHSDGVLTAVSSDSMVRLWDLRTRGSGGNHLMMSLGIHEAGEVGQGGGMQGLGEGREQVSSFPPSEALTHDWNKYRSTVVAVAGVDRIIRTFDIRQPGQGPLQLLRGHEYAVRKVAWSPHRADLLVSASYDMSCRVWSDGGEGAGGGGGGVGDGKMGMGPGRELGRMGRHSEFVTGVDWCLFGAEGWAASCGWDERVCVWDARALMG